MEVTPTSRKGTLGTWWFRCSTWQSDAEPTISLTCETGLSFGQTTEVGAYADQRLNLAKLGTQCLRGTPPNHLSEVPAITAAPRAVTIRRSPSMENSQYAKDTAFPHLVEESVLQQLPQVSEVLVHVEPEEELAAKGIARVK